MASHCLRPACEPPGRRPGLLCIRPRRIWVSRAGPDAGRRGDLGPGRRPSPPPPAPDLPCCPSLPGPPAAPAAASPARAHLLDVVETGEHADAPVVEDGELLRQLLLTGLQHGARHGGGGGAAAGLLAPSHRPAAAATALGPPPLPPATSASGERAHGLCAPIPRR